MLATRLLLAAAVPLLGACRPDVPQELPPRLKPLLETLGPRYRPLNRQDTLTSYWAPDSGYAADSLFQLIDAQRSQVLLRVRFVPASVAAAAGLDTLRFRRASIRFEDDRPGYTWDFFQSDNPRTTVPETAEGLPLRMRVTYDWRLALTENRQWPDGRVYSRNDYLMDYPFDVEADARVSDSVVYVRAYPLLADQPRPDTLYTYYHGGEHRKRIPLVADQLDTTRQALLRLSFRVLSHSAD